MVRASEGNYHGIVNNLFVYYIEQFQFIVMQYLLIGGN